VVVARGPEALAYLDVDGQHVADMVESLLRKALSLQGLPG